MWDALSTFLQGSSRLWFMASYVQTYMHACTKQTTTLHTLLLSFGCGNVLSLVLIPWAQGFFFSHGKKAEARPRKEVKFGGDICAGWWCGKVGRGVLRWAKGRMRAYLAQKDAGWAGQVSTISRPLSWASQYYTGLLGLPPAK